MDKKNARSRFFEAKSKLQAIYKVAKDEGRALTEAEASEATQLRSEMDQANIEMSIEAGERMAAIHGNITGENRERERALEFARQAVEAMKGGKIELRSDDPLIDKAAAQPLVALTIGDIIGPLEKGLVLEAVGCHIQSGLHDDWLYPVVEAVEASVAGEAVEISDSEIELNSVQPTPRRVAISVPVTKTAVVMTNDRLRGVVIEQLALAIKRTLNKWMFGASPIATGVKGLFIDCTTQNTTDAFSYADICKLVGDVDSTGVLPSSSAVFVMNNATKALLKATPRGNGDRMIIEENKIDGIPVFVTEYAPAGAVYFGYFNYALVGQFGDADLVVDPYTLAKKNEIQFTLNTFWDIKAARAQAFGYLKLNEESSSEAESSE